MPRPTTPSLYSEFLGLNDGTQVGERQASVLQNAYLWNSGRELVRRAGTSRLAGTGVGASIPFDGLHAARIGGTDYLVAAHGGALEDWLTSGSAISGGSGKITSGSPVGGAFLPYALYMGNGASQNQRFDGSTIAQVMTSQGSSAMIISSGGSGTLTGQYSFRVTFLSADGHDSQASAKTIDITATSALQFNLSAIPTAPAGEDCSGRRIWRTIAGGTTWYLVGTINDNTTTTFTDSTADADVDTSQAIDLNAVRFPPCQVLAAHQLRLAGILCSTAEGDQRTLYLSNYEAPWYCPNVAPLDSVDDPTLGARIPLPETPVGIVPYGNVLVTFFRNQTWRLIGDNPNNWQFDRWLDVGCVSQRTARVYKSVLLWLAGDGVYAVEGTDTGIEVSRISDDIRAHIDATSAADIAAAHSFVWNDRYYLCFPSAAFYYDFRYRSWGEITAWEWDHSAQTQNSGTSRDNLYATANGLGQVWQLETGTTDNGAAIPVRWKSRDNDMGQFAREKRVHRVVCQFKVGTGDATVNLYRGAGELLQTFTQDLATVVRPGSIISELDDRATEGARDEWFNVEVLHEALSSDFRLLTAGLMYTLCT